MIRRAEERDLAVLREIYNEAIVNSTATFDMECKSVEDRQQWFAAHIGKHRIYVYTEDDIAIAYASFSEYRDRPAFQQSVELSVYIEKGHRGMGIGKKLMAFMLEEAKMDVGIHTVISLITSENVGSIELHKQFGFHFCGRIQDAGFKFGRYLHMDIFQIIV